MLYINAYAVTRHYGGPEEGGWWWNGGMPLASVPLTCHAIPCPTPDDCTCAFGNDGIYYADAHDDDRHYAYDVTEYERLIASLKTTLAHETYGDIYSVNGGQEVSFRLEDRLAEPWPKETPHYE